jgi:hypothetical protein
MANAKAPTRILHVDGDSFFATRRIFDLLDSIF